MEQRKVFPAVPAVADAYQAISHRALWARRSELNVMFTRMNFIVNLEVRAYIFVFVCLLACVVVSFSNVDQVFAKCCLGSAVDNKILVHKCLKPNMVAFELVAVADCLSCYDYARLIFMSLSCCFGFNVHTTHVDLFIFG